LEPLWSSILLQMMNPELNLTHWQGVAELSVQDGFTPITILPSNAAQGVPLRVVWAEIGHGPFHAPFFGEDLTVRLADARWFVSTAAPLLAYAIRSPGVPLRGAILHMSRCGSTLARNLLGATDRSLVMSEAGLVNSALAEFTTRSLQPAMSGFLRPDGDRLQRGYLKCTSWNVLAADREGFPKEFNSPEFAASNDPIERVAIRLRDFLMAAHRLERQGLCRIVKYPEIISRFIDGDLPEYFGYDVDATTRTRMLGVAEFNSKNPGNRFRSDSAEKQQVARESPALNRAYEEHLQGLGI
jgi:hypothetical protein